MPMRSLQSFDGDRNARKDAAQAWSDFKDERGGEKGIAGARYGLALKAANAAAPAAASGALESRRALGLAGAPSAAPAESAADKSKERLVQYSQQGQFIAGKSFFQNSQQWTDSAVQKQTNAKRLRIQFGSRDYFDLVATQPKALPWLALGQNVQFVLNDTVYDIYE
jgi:hypothetical protein